MQQASRGFLARIARRGLLLALSTVVLGLSGVDMASASDAKSVTVEGAFARATIGGGRVGAAYFTIRNSVGGKDRLVGVSTEIAKRAELHTHLHQNGVMKMRPIDGVDVPAGGMVALKPGGDHVMLTGLSGPLKEGSHFPIVLTFEKAGEISVMATVGGIGANKADHVEHKKKHGHGD